MEKDEMKYECKILVWNVAGQSLWQTLCIFLLFFKAYKSDFFSNLD